MKENAYFDNAATTWPKPEPVYAFMDRFFRSHGVNPGRSGHALAVEAEQMVVDTRRQLARFFGHRGDWARVVFTQNGTDALNLALGGLLSPGDHLVTTRLEHNAVLRTASHLERDGQIAVTRVAPAPDGYIDPEALGAAVGPKTRLLVVNHASNVTGAVQALSKIAAMADRRGIPLVVDAAQTAGVLPIDMHELNIAALAFPGHKGLFGPMGIGGLIVAEGLDIRPQRFGGTGVDSLATFQPDDYPYRLEAGTVSLPGIAGLHAAQRWFGELGRRQPGGAELADDDHAALCRLAIDHIHDVELRHLERIESRLKSFSNVRLIGEARTPARVATLSFQVDGMSTSEVADRLDADHHVCARAGLQCAPLVHVDAGTVDSGGTVRLSPGYFTDEEDMEQLLAGLDDVLGAT